MPIQRKYIITDSRACLSEKRRIGIDSCIDFINERQQVFKFKPFFLTKKLTERKHVVGKIADKNGGHMIVQSFGVIGFRYIAG